MMKKFVLYLSKKHPTLYGLLYFLLFMILLTAVSFLPYIYRAFVYPLFYEKEEMSGIIEEVTIKNNSVHARYRSTDMPTYYFRINDTDVRVTPSIVREYAEGDVLDYIQYTRDKKVIGDSREYSLLWGIAALLLEFLIGFMAVSYFCVDTEEDTKKENKVKRGLPQPADCKELSTKELYELCLSHNVPVIKGKRNNRQYLERCLRNENGQRSFSRKWREEQERKNRPSHIIFIVVIILALLGVITNYVRFIYHFIYLFT